MEKVAGRPLDPLGPGRLWPDIPPPLPVLRGGVGVGRMGEESGQTGFLCLSPLSEQAKGQGRAEAGECQGDPGGACSERGSRAQTSLCSGASSLHPGLTTIHLGASVFYKFIPYHPPGGGRP